MSGDVVLLCRSSVRKSFPMCLHLSMSISVLMLRPTGMSFWCPRSLCLAFRSPRITTVSCLFSNEMSEIGGGGRWQLVKEKGMLFEGAQSGQDD